MIKKTIQIGLVWVQIIAVDGKGTIRTPDHKQTKAIYEMIQKRMLEKVEVNLTTNPKIIYSERLNAVIEEFPGLKEDEILKLIEEDIKDKDKVVDKVKKQAEEAIKNKGK